eukprot:scaffold4077_cov417-Prasinococcus_capsulatus_cf.AAC.1
MRRSCKLRLRRMAACNAPAGREWRDQQSAERRRQGGKAEAAAAAALRAGARRPRCGKVRERGPAAGGGPGPPWVPPPLRLLQSTSSVGRAAARRQSADIGVKAAASASLHRLVRPLHTVD